MQEILPITLKAKPIQFPELRTIISGIKWILIGVWRPVRWLLEAMLVRTTEQEYIEQKRDRMRLICHI